MHGGNSREGLFAPTPPLEALKLVISLAVSRAGIHDWKDTRKMMFIDISKAYLHARVINEELSVQLAAEMEKPSQRGWLKKAL